MPVELPTEAVNTLSDTAWGAILVMMAFMMGSAIIYLTLYVRSLNRTVLEVSEKRTKDAKDFGELTRSLEREALTATNAAREAVKDLQRSNEGLGKELDDLRVEVRRALDKL